MNKQTYDIIMACKSSGCADRASKVKAYLAKEYTCDELDYTESDIAHIMINAAYDYIDTCDKPSAFLRELNGIFEYSLLSVGERIARAFQHVRVKNQNGEYINGFGKWAN